MTSRSRPAWYRAMLYQMKHRGDPCHYCGKPAVCLDHVIELQEGGANHPSNLVPACERCNTSKGRATQLRLTGRGNRYRRSGGGAPPLPRHSPGGNPRVWKR